MRYFPSFDEFAALAAGHTVVPVYRQLIGDTLTPVSAFCKIQEGDWAFLFESVIGGEKVGRYSFLGHRAVPPVRGATGGPSTAARTPAAPQVRSATHPDPLRELEELLAGYRAPHLPGLPRFCGGAVGYAGYDAVRYVERLPNAAARRPRPARPVLRLLRPHGHLRPHPQDRRWSSPTPTSIRQRPADALRRRLPPGRRAGRAAAAGRGRPAADRHRHRRRRSTGPCRVELHPARRSRPRSRQCQEYIKAGDIFQVVLSQRFQVETHGPAVRHLPGAAGRSTPARSCSTSRPGRLLPGRQLAGDHGAGSRAARSRSARWPAPAAAGNDEAEDQAPGRGAAGRPQGAGRAHHARGPGPQRRRPGGRATARVAAHRRDEGRARTPTSCTSRRT